MRRQRRLDPSILLAQFNQREVNRRDFIRIAALSGLTLGLAACGTDDEPSESDSPSESGTETTATTTDDGEQAGKTDMTVALFTEPSTLNAVTASGDNAASQVMSNIFNGLVRFNPQTGELEPELATSWEQTDETTWVFELQQGVMFHKDYGEMTAEDVAFNINLTVNENKPRKFLYFFVTGAEAIDTYTVEVRLEQPFIPFVGTTMHNHGGFIVSQKAYEEMGEEAYNRSPIGTGPFMVESWTSGSEIVLVRNPDYWKPDLPKLERITFRPVVDTVVKKNLLTTGEIDFADALDRKDVASLREDPNLEVSSVPGWNWDYITFNLTNPDLPIASKQVRQAISYAIDRQSVVENVYYNEAIPEDDPFPQQYLGADPDQESYPATANLERARELLAEAGYEDGFTITCMTSDKGNLRRQLELVASQLSEIGIEVQIENTDLGTYNTRNREQDFEMALEDITIMTSDPDSSVYWFLHTGTIGWHGYENEELDTLLNDARSEADEDRRAEMYRRVVEIIHEDVPYIYTAHTNLVRVWRKGLTGYEPSPQETHFYLEEASWEA